MNDGILANCTRCSCPIKHVFFYQDKPYGSECVEIVSGIKVWAMDDERNVDEYIAKREARMAKAAQEIEAKETEIKKSREYYYNKNAWLIDYLMDKDNKRYYPPSGKEIRIQEKGFCYSIAQELFRMDIEQLSDKQFQIVADMWSKEFGGRAGSKKYDKAWDDFCDKCGLE